MNLSDLFMTLQLEQDAKKLIGGQIDPGRFPGNLVNPIKRPIAMTPQSIDPGHQVRPGVGMQPAGASVQGGPGVVNDMQRRGQGKPPLMRTARNQSRGRY